MGINNPAFFQNFLAFFEFFSLSLSLLGKLFPFFTFLAFIFPSFVNTKTNSFGKKLPEIHPERIGYSKGFHAR